MIVNKINSELSITHLFVEKYQDRKDALQSAYDKFAPVLEKQLDEYEKLQFQKNNDRFISRIYYENLKQINMIWLNNLAAQYAALINREKIMESIIKDISEIDVLYIGRCVYKTYTTNNNISPLLSIIINLKKTWCTSGKLAKDINDIIEALDIKEDDLRQEVNVLPKYTASHEYYVSSIEYKFMLIGFSANEINQMFQLKDIKFVIVHNDLCEDYWLWRGHYGYYKPVIESNMTSIFKEYFMANIEPYGFAELLLGIDPKIFEYCLDQLENFREIITTDIGYFIILNFIAIFHDIKTPIILEMKCEYCSNVMKYMGTLPVCQECHSRYICCKKTFRTWLFEGLFDVYCIILNNVANKYFDSKALENFINLKVKLVESKNDKTKIYTVDEILREYDQSAAPGDLHNQSAEYVEADINPAFDFR